MTGGKSKFDERRAKDLRAKLKTEQRWWRQLKLLKLLNELDDPVVIDALIWALRFKEMEPVRLLAIKGLAEHRSDEGRLALLSAAIHGSEAVRRHATESLANYELSGEEIESMMPVCLAGDKFLRLATAELLASQSDAAATAPLLTLLEDPKWVVRGAAFDAIRDRDDPNLLPALHRAAEREGSLLRSVLHRTAEEPAEGSAE
ncbi:MAG: HEAT repeat domain-containing protein [Solirubrobacterales bacterium]